jgi:hypothetical protein
MPSISHETIPLNIEEERGFHIYQAKRWNLDGIFFLLFFYLTNPELVGKRKERKYTIIWKKTDIGKRCRVR